MRYARWVNRSCVARLISVRWSIRSQILLPFAVVTLLVVAGATAGAAFLAARQQEQQTLDQLDRLVNTLGQASYPISDTVLEMMRGLSGAHFIAQNLAGKTVAATLDLPPHYEFLAGDVAASERVDWRTTSAMQWAETDYLVARVKRHFAGEQRVLFVLYPEARWSRARLDAATLPLTIGCGAMLLTLTVAAGLAQRLKMRLDRLDLQVARIAQGDFGEFALSSRNDEFQDVERSVNVMAIRLSEMQQTLKQSEQQRLLAQLASGLAHSLRNAATGARLAVQLHHKRCATTGGDQSLDVALRQLKLMESQVKGLLSLATQPPMATAIEPVDINQIVSEVAILVAPNCNHSHVTLQTKPAVCIVTVNCEQAALLAAVMNLTINAIEATSPGGDVCIAVQPAVDSAEIVVTDSGPGIPPDIVQRLFEPFVTTKPEGIGLGLAMVQHFAHRHGGTIQWCRTSKETEFRLSLPMAESRSTLSTPVDEVSRP